MSLPVFYVVAGANGAGKTTLTRGNRSYFSAIPLLDPDAIASAIRFNTAASSQIAAGREVLNRVKTCLSARRSFAIETTLSGKTHLNFLKKSKLDGFTVVLIYVGTEMVKINLERIEARVSAGGHDVAEEDVRRRYSRSLSNLPAAIVMSDYTMIFDNSGLYHRLIAVFEGGLCSQSFEPIPNWFKSAIEPAEGRWRK